MNIGILALQGAFREHRQMIEKLGVRACEVRLPRDLNDLQGLIIPGGESTTIGKLMLDYGLRDPIREFAQQGRAVWGTCAGAIMLADDIQGVPPQFGAQPSLNLMRLRVRRNAFGRQVDSFEAALDVSGFAEPYPALFIRAPVIEQAGEGVDILAQHEGRIVLARQGHLLASSFHPELTGDNRLHDLFVRMARREA